MFDQEKEAILTACGKDIDAVEHIGSTAVPGLAAKPVIDILVGVPSLDLADVHCIEPIVSLGYEYNMKRFEASMPLRRYFRKNNRQGQRTHLIHMVKTGSDFWKDPLLFRDHLRQNRDDRLAYERLKRDLVATRKWDTGSEFAAAKGPFIREVLRRAKAQRI
jgi:GrpB-like predicted nucleotidyltransferase (UPF0157 family)